MRDPRGHIAEHVDFGLDVWCNADEELAMLERELETLGQDDAHRAALLLYEQGRIRLALGQEVDATQLLLRSYTLRPQFRPTIQLARQVYRHRGDHKLVVKLLDAEAQATRDPLARAALLRQQAHVLWLRVGDREGANERLKEALRLDATSLPTLKLIDLLALAADNQDDRRNALLRQIDVLTDDPLRVALLVDLALLRAPRAPGAAIEALQRALALHPGSRSVLLFLEALLSSGESPGAALADVLDAQIGLPDTSDALRARLHGRVARVRRDALGDHAGAIEAFLASLALRPTLDVAADCFELLLATGQRRAALEVGAQLFELDDAPRFRAPLACRLGDLAQSLDASDLAVCWYRRCLRSAPAYQPALEGLSRLLEAREDPEALLVMHRSDLAAAKTPRGKAQRLYRIATLLQRLERAPEAIEAHREAQAALPGFLPSSSALEHLFAQGGRWTELLQLYDEQLNRERDTDRVVHILETMAAIWHHQLGHLDNAIECYQRVLSQDENNLRVIRTTARLCAEARRWDELQELSERETTLVQDPQRRAEILHRSGEVWEERLHDLDRAIDAYQRALSQNPRYLPALRALGRIHRQRGQWTELIAMHRAEIAVSSDAEQILDLLMAVAEVQDDELLDPASATETYREALRRRPAHRPAIQALERLYEDQHRWEELADLLEASIDIAGDKRSKALRLWKIGLLREERLGDPKAAMQEHSRALRLTPDLAPAQASLARLHEEAGDGQRLFDLLATNLEQSADDQQRRTLALHLADLLERRGDNLRQAAQLYERAAEGERPPLWALWSLVRIYRRLGLQSELCHTLDRLLEEVSDPRLRAEIALTLGRERMASGADPLPAFALAKATGAVGYAERAAEQHIRSLPAEEDRALDALLTQRAADTRDPFERASLLSELGDRALAAGEGDIAETHYRQALEEMRGHLGASFGLARILEESGRWAERANLAEQEAATLESTEELSAALLRAGVLWQERLGDDRRAAGLYERALHVHPGHPEAYERLRQIHQAAGAWTELASLIRNQITATSDDEAVVEMFRDLGRIYLEHLGQQRKAEACLRRVVDLSPFDTYALLTLGRLYVERGKWQAAEGALTQAEGVLVDRAERCAVRRDLAQVYHALRDPLRALESLSRALEDTSTPDRSLLVQVAEAAEAANRPRAQADALERVADLSTDAGEQIALRMRVAQLSEERLDDADRAIRVLQQVLAANPLDMEATEQLAAIYGRLGNRSAVNQHLQAAVSHHRAEIAARPREAQLYRHIGRVFRWQRLFDRLYCSCVVLEHLGAITETERHFLTDHARRCAAYPAAPLAPQRLERLLYPAEARSPLRATLRAVSPALRKLLVDKPAAHGLSRGSRATAQSPVAQAIRGLAELLALREFQIWVSTKEPEALRIATFSEPALIVGASLAERLASGSSPTDRYRLGQIMLLLSEGAQLLLSRPPARFLAMLGALGQIVTPTVELPFPAEVREQIPAELPAVNKALARKDRKPLGALLAELAPAVVHLHAGRFYRGLACAAQRAGLLLAGDPLPALAEFGRGSGGASDALADPQTLGADLLSYLVGEEYFTLRIEAGLAPGSG